jgi:hypothetical protein
MIPIPFFDDNFQLSVESLSDLLPGRSAGLDIICDGILQGTDFIYQPEQSFFSYS